MIDLHCHLHYACDDGPREARESVDLARALLDAGVTEVACTPHIRSDKGWLNVKAEQPKLFARLDAVLAAAEVELPRRSAAEHYLDETLFEEPLQDRVVPYGESKTLLVELPYSGPPADLFGLLFRLRRKGYYILLAHLERYPYVVDDDDAVQRLLDAGHLIQVNLGSLAGAYSRAHKKAAIRLVERGQASVAAGDCHRAEDVKKMIGKGRKVLEKMVGAAGAERLLVENPWRILSGAAPEKVWP